MIHSSIRKKKEVSYHSYHWAIPSTQIVHQQNRRSKTRTEGETVRYIYAHTQNILSLRFYPHPEFLITFVSRWRILIGLFFFFTKRPLNYQRFFVWHSVCDSHRRITSKTLTGIYTIKLALAYINLGFFIFRVLLASNPWNLKQRDSYQENSGYRLTE